MKKVTYFTLFALVVLATSCGGSGKKKSTIPSKDEIKASIASLEDSLKMMQKKEGKMESFYHLELVNRLKSFYAYYPNDSFSAICLDKIHMIYSGLDAVDYSIAYADTLLEKFPKYENRAMVLESQGANYDVIKVPRDSMMVKKYYSQLLKEFPNMDREKKKGIENRLLMNHLTFEEYISTSSF